MVWVKCVKVERRKRKRPSKDLYPTWGGDPYAFVCYAKNGDVYYSVPMSLGRFGLLAHVSGFSDWEWVECIGYNVRYCHTSTIFVTPQQLIWVDDGVDGPRYPRRLAALFDTPQEITLPLLPLWL